MSRIRLSFILLILITPVGLYAGAHFLEFNNSGKKITRRWENPSANWRYNTSGAPAGAQALIQAAFDIWKNQSQSTVNNSFQGTTTNGVPKADGFSDIIFGTDLSTLGLGIDTGSIVAITFRNGDPDLIENLDSEEAELLKEADILVNPFFVYQTDPATSPTDLDIVEILGHEIGHLYGLAHSFFDRLTYVSGETFWRNTR